MEIFTTFDINLVIRVISALLLGFVIGLEREMTNKYAGLRTNILVCLGACVFTIISIYGFPAINITAAELGTRDTARVAAQVVTGIGFIGGGTVLRHGSNIFGLTTAATLFMAASIGMACGAGMFDLALIATICSVITLVSIRIFEQKILVKSTKNTKRLKIELACNLKDFELIYSSILDFPFDIKEINKNLNESSNDTVNIDFIAEIKAKKPIKVMYTELDKLNGINSITINEFCD